MRFDMRILVYKRTHNGDPDASGCFGTHDCMGTIRDRDFDAVIGVGGIGSEAEVHDIAGKVNWIGLCPHKTATHKRGPNVRFEHFLDYGTEGPSFAEFAPTLARRMYSQNVRHIIDNFTATEYAEALALLRRAIDAPPSASLNVTTPQKGRTGCGVRRQKAKRNPC